LLNLNIICFADDTLALIKEKSGELLFNLGNTSVNNDNNGMAINLNKTNFIKFSIYKNKINSIKNYKLFFHKTNCKQIFVCDCDEIKELSSIKYLIILLFIMYNLLFCELLDSYSKIETTHASSASS